MTASLQISNCALSKSLTLKHPILLSISEKNIQSLKCPSWHGIHEIASTEIILQNPAVAYIAD